MKIYSNRKDFKQSELKHENNIVQTINKKE